MSDQNTDTANKSNKLEKCTREIHVSVKIKNCNIIKQGKDAKGEVSIEKGF